MDRVRDARRQLFEQRGLGQLLGRRQYRTGHDVPTDSGAGVLSVTSVLLCALCGYIISGITRSANVRMIAWVFNARQTDGRTRLASM